MDADDSHTIFHQQNLCEIGYPAMEEIRRRGKLCDVTLKVGDHLFTAHKLVLAATVPYFNAMFLHDMQESQLSQIEIHDIDATALESLINFAYTGRIRISSDTVQTLMMAATFLSMDSVRDACAQYMIKQLSLSNVLGVRKFSSDLGCVALSRAADRYLHKHFSSVVAPPAAPPSPPPLSPLSAAAAAAAAEASETADVSEFLLLKEQELSDILTSDELNVSSEETVFEAVLRWVQHDTESRAMCLPRLLASVRMPLLSPQFIVDRVATQPLIHRSLLCRDLLDEARDYLLLPERRSLMRHLNTRPRCCSAVVSLIYVIGGLAKSGSSLSTVEVYHPVTERWSLAERMARNRSRVGVTSLDGRLYAIGGFNGTDRLSTVEVFEPTKRVWRQVAQLNYRRSALGAAAVNGQIYVCGGYDGNQSLSTVERFCPRANTWSLVARMIRHRSAAGVVTLDGRIFVLGGHDGLSIFDSVECFDPVTGMWSLGPPMLTKRCRLGAAVLCGKLYVCGGYDGTVFLRSVECFDPITNVWSYVAPMCATRSRVSLVAAMGRLYAIGGYDGSANLSTVEVYEPLLDRWQPGVAMCAHEGGVGVGVLTAPD